MFLLAPETSSLSSKKNHRVVWHIWTQSRNNISAKYNRMRQGQYTISSWWLKHPCEKYESTWVHLPQFWGAKTHVWSFTTYKYIPRTQMTPILIGKCLVLEGLTFKNRGHRGSRYTYIHIYIYNIYIYSYMFFPMSLCFTSFISFTTCCFSFVPPKELTWSSWDGGG